MLDESAAAATAAAFLDNYQRQFDEPGTGKDVRTEPERSFRDGRFFIVPWNSVALLDHGDQEAELAGNWPIMVDLETGTCRFMEYNEYFMYLDRGFQM